MDKQKIINKTYKYIKGLFLGEASGHDWWHIYRVWNTAKILAKKEKANSFIVQMAALLHDLGDYKLEIDNKDRQEQKVFAWLKKVKVSGNYSKQILDIILNMSFSKNVIRKQTLSKEGQVVQDADRLDALGAMGIARAFVYTGAKARPMYDPNEPIRIFKTTKDYQSRHSIGIQHFYEKLLKLKDHMNTKSGKILAKQRHRFMEKYLKQFFAEWRGEDIKN